MGADQRYSLKWNNYQNQLVTAFESLLAQQDFVDVTLGVEGKRLLAHKMLLSACSPYFRELLKSNPCQHPIIIIKDLKYEDVESLLHFMYNGEVNVAQESLDSFLKSAESLKIRGLTENDSMSSDRQAIPSSARRKRSNHTDVISKLNETQLKREVVEISNEEEITENNPDYSEPQSGALVPVEEEEELLEIPEDRPQGFNFEDGFPVEYVCDICSKVFHHPESIASHKKYHSGHTTCYHCKHQFSTVGTLNRHIRQVHKIEPSGGQVTVRQQQDTVLDFSISQPILYNSLR